MLTVTGVVYSQLPWGAAPCRIQPLPGSVQGSLALVALFIQFLCCVVYTFCVVAQ